MLADMGADVVKVEPPKGDPMRTLNPITNERGPSPYHALVNAGKRVITLDLKSAPDISHFQELVRATDVLLESYRPGVMERLGFGWETLQTINPKLVHCALSGFGQNGPFRLTAGHDINYVAAAGQLGLTGAADTPHPAFPMVADYAGALQATISMLGALIGRGTSGKGAFIDVAMTDAVLAWQSQTLAATQLGDAVARDQNMLTGGAAFYRVYQCSDEKFVCLGAIEEIFWRNFCDAVDQPQWVPRQHEDLPQAALIDEIECLFMTKTQEEWRCYFEDIDCCFQILPTPDQLSSSPQHQSRKVIGKIPTPDHGELNTTLYPAWVNGVPPNQRAEVQFSNITEVLSDWGESK